MAFVVLSAVSHPLVPGRALTRREPPQPARRRARADAGCRPAAQQELEKFMAAQQRVPVMVATEGAAVVLVKFNDYMCPPCGQTFAQYKPVLAQYAKEYPGKLKYVTQATIRSIPNATAWRPSGSHMASCEAAVAVRLAREKGKADAMENWLFANQPTLTPASVKEAARILGGVTDFDARYATVLTLVKGDIEQGGQLQVQGTPTFFLNGIRLPGLRARVPRRRHRPGDEAGGRRRQVGPGRRGWRAAGRRPRIGEGSRTAGHAPGCVQRRAIVRAAPHADDARDRDRGPDQGLPGRLLATAARTARSTS